MGTMTMMKDTKLVYSDSLARHSSQSTSNNPLSKRKDSTSVVHFGKSPYPSGSKPNVTTYPVRLPRHKGQGTVTLPLSKRKGSTCLVHFGKIPYHSRSKPNVTTYPARLPRHKVAAQQLKFRLHAVLLLALFGVANAMQSRDSPEFEDIRIPYDKADAFVVGARVEAIDSSGMKRFGFKLKSGSKYRKGWKGTIEQVDETRVAPQRAQAAGRSGWRHHHIPINKRPSLWLDG